MLKSSGNLGKKWNNYEDLSKWGWGNCTITKVEDKGLTLIIDLMKDGNIYGL